MSNNYDKYEELFAVKGNSARIYQLEREQQRFLERNPDIEYSPKRVGLENPNGFEMLDIDDESWIDYLLKSWKFSHLEKHDLLVCIRKQPIGYKCLECGEIIVLNYMSNMIGCDCLNLEVDSNEIYTRYSFKMGKDSVEEIERGSGF